MCVGIDTKIVVIHLKPGSSVVYIDYYYTMHAHKKESLIYKKGMVVCNIWDDRLLKSTLFLITTTTPKIWMIGMVSFSF